MITINIESAGKKFHREWIFRNISLQIEGREKVAVTGNNGSGKSTLLQIISGFQSLTSGTITFQDNQRKIESADRFRYVSYAAPYLELPEHYTLEELLAFQGSFKPFLPNLTQEDILSLLELRGADQKSIRNFSSGMKQRVKLALAIFSSAPVLLLDEPLSNLDKAGIGWYRRILPTYTAEKTVIICSNFIEDETEICHKRLILSNQEEQ